MFETNHRLTHRKVNTIIILSIEEEKLTLIREFLGPSPSVFSEKKSRIIGGDVTIGTSKMKIICADTVSVGPSYDTNFKWHMPI